MRSVLGLFLVLAATLSAQVKLPPYARQMLPNGIVLDVIPRRDVPLVTIRVLVRGGIESDPAELSGLASATAEALRRGTATRSAEQFSRSLDELGASFETGADYQSTHVAIELLSKDFSKGLDLLADAIARPTFPAAEVQKLIAQRVDAAKALKDNPGASANDYYRNLFFGVQHPYGRPPDEKTLAAITRDAIVDTHRKMYAGRNMILVVAGDVDPETATSAVTKIFGELPAGSAYQWKKTQLSRPEKPVVGIVNKPDATETQFRIGMPGLDRTHPDRVPLWVVNTLFGGRFTSVLNDALRVDSGLTYGAGSSVDQNHLPGRITISSFTATATTAKAIDLALEVMQKVAQKGITAEQLASAKAYLKGTYPADRLETPDQLAEVVGEIELFDLNRGEVDDLFSRIDAVTVEKANQVAQRYLKPESLTFLLLGDAAKFEADVAKYSDKPIKVSITEPGVRIAR